MNQQKSAIVLGACFALGTALVLAWALSHPCDCEKEAIQETPTSVNLDI